MGGRGTYDKSVTVADLRSTGAGSGGGGNGVGEGGSTGGELTLFDRGEVRTVEAQIVESAQGGQVERASAGEKSQEVVEVESWERGGQKRERSGSRSGGIEKMAGREREQSQKQGGKEEGSGLPNLGRAARVGAKVGWEALKVGGMVSVGGIAIGHASVPEIDIGNDVRGGMGIAEGRGSSSSGS